MNILYGYIIIGDYYYYVIIIYYNGGLWYFNPLYIIGNILFIMLLILSIILIYYLLYIILQWIYYRVYYFIIGCTSVWMLTMTPSHGLCFFESGESMAGSFSCIRVSEWYKFGRILYIYNVYIMLYIQYIYIYYTDVHNVCMCFMHISCHLHVHPF